MEEKGSHKQILKSTGIIGGSQVIVIGLGIVRTKILAILLGPVGVGISGLYQSAIDMIKGATSLGLQYSAVRDIAAAAGTGDESRIATTIRVLRRWVWFTALLGALIAIAFCKPLSRATFNDESHAVGIAVLSLSILLTTLAAGQTALLQGLRRIADMARSGVYAAVAGLFIAVPIYWYLGQKGIVPVILLTSVVTLALSWYFVSNIPVQKAALNWRQTWARGQAMVKLGFFIVVAGFVEIATGYMARILVVKNLGPDGVGNFLAAWTISSLYMSAVLNAMSADYFPRLSAVQHDNKAMTRLINEQAEIALLVACPLIVGMISFIHLIVQIFYTKQFSLTPFILNWQLAGDFFKILAWPVAFGFLAQGKGKIHVLTNLLWCLVYVGIVYGGWHLLGIEITGVAFLLSYVIYFAVVLLISKKTIGFGWSEKMVKLMVVYAPLIALAFLSSRFISFPYQMISGTAISLVTALFSFHHLKKIINFSTILQRLKGKKA